MEDELRQAFADVHTTIERNYTKLETKLDGVSTGLNQHVLQSAIRQTEVRAMAEAAHARQDRHEASHSRWAGVFAGLAVTLAAAGIVGLVTAVVKIAAMLPALQAAARP